MSGKVITSSGPRFLDAGDSALVVELGSTIEEEINRQVVALEQALAGAAMPGVIETLPTYRSLLVVFDPDILTKDDLKRLVLSFWPVNTGLSGRGTRWLVPVHYGGAFGEDLEHVAEVHGLSSEEVIALHSGVEYRVFMIGFAPGFAYLGGLPERLHTSRRKDPRLKTPPGSISIGGQQAAVTPPLEIPSGWHLLGRTPVRSYDPSRKDRPFLFSPGDLVRFRPIPREEFDLLAERAAQGDAVATREAVDG